MGGGATRCVRLFPRRRLDGGVAVISLRAPRRRPACDRQSPSARDASPGAAQLKGGRPARRPRLVKHTKRENRGISYKVRSLIVDSFPLPPNISNH